MKKALTLASALTALAVGMGLAGVTNSKHDLRASNPNLSNAINFGYHDTDQPCHFCHVIHGNLNISERAERFELLWNVNAPEPEAGSWLPYQSTYTTTSSISNDILLSKLETTFCLHCHDGTVGSITFYRDASDGTPGSFTWKEDAAANLGHTFTDDHPVGFVYPDSSAPNFGDLNPYRLFRNINPDYGVVVDGAVTNTVYPLYGEEDEATMECATCHDVHAGQTSVVQFMRHETSGGGEELDIISGSRICMDCHTEK